MSNYDDERELGIEEDFIIDFEAKLPYGEMLRPLLACAELAKTDLKKLLFQRGVYISNNEKEASIPILTQCLLKPEEFEILVERQKNKEEIEKRKTQTITWDSDVPLIEALDMIKIPYDDLNDRYSTNYFVVGNPDVSPESNDVMILDYSTIRTDPTKDWVKTRSKHKAKIVLTKVDDGRNLRIDMVHSSQETQILNEKIIKFLIRELKNTGHINNKKEVRKILFGDFSNNDRIKFMLNLLVDDKDGVLRFKEVTHVEIEPDATQIQTLPNEINWMANRVHNLILKGELLHDTEFVKDPKYHQCLIFEQIEAVYNFDYRGIQGTCRIEYGFPSINHPEPTAEFEMKITSMKFSSTVALKEKREVRRVLYDKFDGIKNEKYKIITGAE